MPGPHGRFCAWPLTSGSSGIGEVKVKIFKLRSDSLGSLPNSGTMAVGLFVCFVCGGSYILLFSLGVKERKTTTSFYVENVFFS